MSRAPFHPSLDAPDWTPDGDPADRLAQIETRLDGIETAQREARWERWALGAGLLILMGRAFGVF